jgi:hypothetical protein
VYSLIAFTRSEIRAALLDLPQDLFHLNSGRHAAQREFQGLAGEPGWLVSSDSRFVRHDGIDPARNTASVPISKTMNLIWKMLKVKPVQFVRKM